MMRRFDRACATWLAAMLLGFAGCAERAPDVTTPTRHSVTLPTGVSLSYVEAGPASAPVVILLHGFIDSHQVFENLLPVLAQRYHVYAPDQRGHGDSDKPECCYAQADYVADLHALMRALAIPRATVLGHSMGAFIAHKFAVEHPAQVEGLVLVAGASACEICADFADQILSVSNPVDPAFVRELQRSSMYAPVDEAWFERVIAESMKVPAHVWHRAFQGLADENHADRLPEIRARTLIIAGDQDDFAADQPQLAAAIPSSTLLIYEQTAHWPFAEQPDRFLTDLLAWLDSR